MRGELNRKSRFVAPFSTVSVNLERLDILRKLTLKRITQNISLGRSRVNRNASVNLQWLIEEYEKILVQSFSDGRSVIGGLQTEAVKLFGSMRYNTEFVTSSLQFVAQDICMRAKLHIV